MTETAQRPGEAGHLNATLGLGGVTLFGSPTWRRSSSWASSA